MKKLLLNILIFSAMLLIAIVGVVSADPICTPDTSCDDGDICTIRDVYDADCECYGTPIPDCLSEPNLYCGDGIVTSLNDYGFNEQCDGSDLNGATCESVLGTGYTGELGCWDTRCTFDISGCIAPECEVTVYLPTAGWYTNSIHTEWEYSQTCTIFDQEVYYNVGPDFTQMISINEIDNNVPRNLDWNAPEEGTYKICVNGQTEEGQTTSGIIDCSEAFNVDLTPPEVFINTVSEPNVGECADGETGECYVNNQTEITLKCTDVMPGSGGGISEYRYRIHYEDGSIGDWTRWESARGGFNFPEDSEHELEYRCFDEVGLESIHKFKTFLVDTVGPIFEDTEVGGPMVCDDDECYINKNTKICVDAYDPNPHPVGLDTITCESNWWEEDNSGEPDDLLSIALNNGCFYFQEDSYHQLHCWGIDFLGNRDADLFGQFIVDTAEPETMIDYTGPEYGEFPKWIDTDSRVVLIPTDPEPHPVGLDKTYYRVEQVDDWMCYEPWEVQWEPTAKDNPSWQVYSEPFPVEESCHVIEYYSTDLLGNSEDVNVEFVFSDHTAPALDISVGESGEDCNSQNVDCEDGWDWIVTMGTPITLSCEDQMPHPSGVQKICYKIFWDGDTEQPTEVCENTNEITIWFRETCEHRVEYTCYDNVEKHSSDSRTFKVIGEDFEIELDKKWNLISVPVNLLSSNVEEVFGGDENIEEVWSYEDGEWFYYIPGDEDSTLMDIVPGRGYWVKTSNPTMLIVGGSLFEAGSVTPNSVPIDSGWNLIGHYGMASKPRICALASIFNEWSTLIGYNSGSTVFYDVFWMNPGEGYWFFAQGDDSYAYSNKGCFGPYLP